MSIQFEITIDSSNPQDDILELKEFIDELNLSGLDVKIKEADVAPETGGTVRHMGAELLPTLEIIVAIAGAGVVAFVNGLFEAIKAYIQTNSELKKITLQKGCKTITFSPTHNNIDPEQMIKDFFENED